MTHSKVLTKMLKPELLTTAQGLDKRLRQQEQATMILFYLFACTLSASLIF